jgi:streptogrisin D
VLGNTVSGSSSGSDIVLVKYADQTISRSGAVDLYNGSSQDILTAASAYVGEPVKRSGSTTGVHSGTVLAVNVTVNYAEGTLTGLIKTNICAESGDVGGPLFDGTKAIGLLVISSGNCSSGGLTYYRPITQPSAVYGVSVY